jgi:hypothetical protein
MKVSIGIIAFAALTSVAVAGTEMSSGKDFKQTQSVAPQQECWYGDTEWNVSVWGAYAFAGTENKRTGIEDTDDRLLYGTYDRYLSQDHAWGGGIDAKYFFMKYFGVGVEGFALAGRSQHAILDEFGSASAFEEHYNIDHHTDFGALGTLTVRFPIGCSRFAPYAWAGGGGVFGGHNDRAVGHNAVVPGFPDRFANDDDGRGVGQFGGGFEYRITRHIGVISDFSWNVVEGPHNNFGMVRTGLNFAF